jgi:hypothetical protein
MSLELTFKGVCSTIKKQGKDDPKLIEAVDNLLGIALVCSPIVLGPSAATVALPLLGAKNELVKIGKSVFEKLTKRKDEDYLIRYDTMLTAYGLLVFTSFFDALDTRIGKTLRREIKLLDSEKAFLAKDAELVSVRPEAIAGQLADAPVSALPFAFPHPTETLTEQCERQSRLWKQMRQGFVEFVQKLSFWDEADEKKRAALLVGLDKIEEDAGHHFAAQYFELARKFEDFAVWANLQGHKGTKALLGELSDYVRHYVRLSESSNKTIDVGFGKLREAVLSIPEILKTQQATEIAESLGRHYQARLNEPIIEDKDTDDDDKPRLSFPKICDAFVPQSFQVTRQIGKSRRLEEESTWSELVRRNDLGAFLLSYLSSPYSTEAPLLVLGHPGSGKSLLTTILAAQLMSKQFTAIRVPLREVNADADIVTQIEEAIKRITGLGVDSWTKLSALFKNCPPLIILDGYDELLQASGQVFASYIKDAQRFQEREAEQGRPLRVIITSRVTLIDKAAIPIGSTIIRLLEFDHQQRECWSGIWNRANANYFRDARIEKFALPDESEKDAEKILNLAQQPLLLLMLALYDSQGNQLRISKGLDRTKLYDSLLRRFIMRERGKEKGFNDTQLKERDKALSIEMQRLGVAALGMYNRRKVHILSNELDEDLAFFKLERDVMAKPGKALSQADLLLGSFFFVHKSKAQHLSGAQETHEETAAFEFLHNTFGEFLTADFILRRAVSQVQALRAIESTEALKPIIDKMMGTADGFERDWFASLIYTPLFTRPVIMEMIREWIPHVLRDHDLPSDGFAKTLEEIVLNQIRRMLSKREMPQIMRRETAQEGYRVPFGDHPLVGHIAIYSINLILLRLVAEKSPFVFDEAMVTSHEDGTRPWDRLIYIWRSWFSLGTLNGLTAVMQADRIDTKITVEAKSKFQAGESKSKLHEFHNVAVSLGDNASAGITGLYLFDPYGGHIDELNSYASKLNAEGYDLGPLFAVAKLRALAERLPYAMQEFVTIGSRTLEQVVEIGRLDQIQETCAIITRCLEQNEVLLQDSLSRLDLFREIFRPGLVVAICERDAKSARAIFKIASRIHFVDWIVEFSERLIDRVSRFEVLPWGLLQSYDGLQLLREIGESGQLSRWLDRRRIHPAEFERMFHPDQLLELSDRNPEGALVYLRVLRQLGGERAFQLTVNELASGFFDRTFRSGHLLEFGEQGPERALIYMQILRELCGSQTLERVLGADFPLEFIRRAVSPREIMAFSERRPEAALTYLQTLRDVVGLRYFEHEFDQEFIGRLIDPRYLRALSERSPESALDYLRVIRELVGGQLFSHLVAREFDLEFLEQTAHPRRLLELCERDPEAALSYLPLFHEMGGEQIFVRHYERNNAMEFLESMLRHLIDVSERKPAGALAFLQILRELSGHRAFKRTIERGVEPELLDQLLHSQSMSELAGRSNQMLTFWLALVCLFPMPRLISWLDKALSSRAKDRLAFKQSLLALPISAIGDLKWLSQHTSSSAVRSVIAELVA